jgi:5-methylcytosine-specific restriction protein A
VRIGDLPNQVTASKADWIASTTWLGFTPTNGSTASRAQCESTIQRQMGDGYVLEYITETAEQPNASFADDPLYLEEREQHTIHRGRFLAVHRLRHSCRPLEQLLGREDFSRLQDMWAQGNKRWRWSVAFPIVESFAILEKPKAAEVLGATSYRRLYAHSSATLRPLNDDERALIGQLEIKRIPASNAWIAIEDQMAAVDASQITSRSTQLIEQDLSLAALEGMLEERKSWIRKRAAWLADQFINQRRRGNALHCDLCRFDPARVLNQSILSARTALDVHHKFPLEEGTRYTSTDDYALLCPNCHRMEHQLLKRGGSFFDRTKAPHLFSN